MKKAFLALLTVILVLSLLPLTVFAARNAALVVYGGTDGKPGAGDTAVGDRLKGLGFAKVDYMFAPKTTDTTWKSYDIVFIGESVTAADVGTKFQKAECYVICGEPGLWDELLIGNYDTTYDSNAYKGKYIVKSDIISSGLKSFDGFSKDATPGFLKEWGKGVTVIVENEKGAPAVTYAAKGAEMFDGSKAAGPRSTIFCRGQSAADFTADTWKVFDALVNYVLPLPKATTAATTKAAATTAAKAAATASAKTADASVVIAAAVFASLAAAVVICKKKH